MAKPESPPPTKPPIDRGTGFLPRIKRILRIGGARTHHIAPLPDSDCGLGVQLEGVAEPPKMRKTI